MKKSIKVLSFLISFLFCWQFTLCIFPLKDNSINTSFWNIKSIGSIAYASDDIDLSWLFWNIEPEISEKTNTTNTWSNITTPIIDTLKINTGSSNESTTNIQYDKTPIEDQVKTVTKSLVFIPHITPNKKIYKIYQLSSGQYIFERLDWSGSSIKFDNYESIIEFLDKNNLKVILETNEIITSPNWKRFTILKNAVTGKFTFKRYDGTISDKQFNTKIQLSSYIFSKNSSLKK